MPADDSRLVWAPAAKKDLREIGRYYLRVASRDVADRLLRDIERTSRLIAQRPLAWRTRDEIMPGLRSILVHPYVIFYRVTDNTVEIARAAEQRDEFASLESA